LVICFTGGVQDAGQQVQVFSQKNKR
jgi:hypothetical protein